MTLFTPSIYGLQPAVRRVPIRFLLATSDSSISLPTPVVRHASPSKSRLTPLTPDIPTGPNQIHNDDILDYPSVARMKLSVSGSVTSCELVRSLFQIAPS
jgi:hypothetical protein